MIKRDDITLLREFSATESEAAFAALVSRHLNLVYSVALRSTGNVHAAQEISQAVFIILARKAANWPQHAVLSGWLYQTTRLTAANFLRGEIRRQQREQEAYMQSTLNESDASVWPQIAPLLDDALGKLGEKDRNAIVLRFFENKNLREVGTALGASEDAAKMRVNRALDKLRKIFGKRGLTLSATLIAGAVSAGSVQAAPAGLAQTISGIAITKGAAAGGSTLALVKGVLKIMAWTKTKTVLTICILLAIASMTTIFTMAKYSRARAQAKFTYVRGEPSNPQLKAQLEEWRLNFWPVETKRELERIKSRQANDETINATTINLKPYINTALTDSPVSSAGNNENNLAELPQGTHIFAGVPFDVEGSIQLMGTELKEFNKSFPVEVDHIPIGQRCAKLHLLQGANWVYAKNFGTLAAKLVLHYTDGSTREIDMITGDTVFDWWGPLFQTGANPRTLQMAPGTERAWAGSNPYISKFWKDESLILYKTTFENPQPDVVVSNLDYVSTVTEVAPFLVGLTVE
jgi:RNA polymerase sigma factor (sigma-70 family)